MTTTESPPEARKFIRDAAISAASDLLKVLRPFCLKIAVVGSVRRLKPYVKDLEIMYVPNIVPKLDTTDLFQPPQMVNLADAAIEELIRQGRLSKRLNALGKETFGPKIKLLCWHNPPLPVDLFSCEEASWFNYMVCRTGPKESNIRIAGEAKRRGLKWEPYSPGFLKSDGSCIPVASEREVFEIVGLKYAEPKDRK